MVSMSLVLTVGVLNLHHPNSNVTTLPKWAKRLFFDILAPLLLLGKYKEYLDDEDSEINREMNDQFQVRISLSIPHPLAKGGGEPLLGTKLIYVYPLN